MCVEMDNLIFSLNATLPLFLLMALGYLLKRIHYISEATSEQLNRLVFKIFLPALLFLELAKEDFAAIWDGEMILFCFLVTVLSILIAFGLSFVSKDRGERGEIIQAGFRSAAATLGIAFMLNLYDSATAVALMIIGSVPLYNVMAVLILSLTSEDKSRDFSAVLKNTGKNIITNPILLSIAAGLLWSILKLPLPVMAERSITYLGNLASPLALIVLGSEFELTAAKEKLKEITVATFTKLLLLCAIFLPIAVHLGFRNEKLVAILIMLGSGTTSSSYIMAKNMGHKGVITSATVMLTTLLMAFTMTLWLFILRTWGYI